MKTADAHRNTASDEVAGKIDGSRKLVRLNADQADQRFPALPTKHSHDLARPHLAIGLVIGVQPELDTGTEHLAPPSVIGKSKEARQGI